MRIFRMAAVFVVLTAPAYAQMPSSGGGGGVPNLSLMPDKPSKTQEEKEADEARDKAYKESLKKIPDAKVSSDPWGTVRTTPAPAPKAASAKPKTKTGSTAN
jgi:hypothetical protein